MQSLALLMLVCCALLASSSSEAEVDLKCRRDVAIALNTTLLPRADIVALSGGNDQPIFPVENIGGSNTGWCANISGEENYINMTFAQPVLLEGIHSFGRTTSTIDAITQHFVSNFSILYTILPESSEPLELYDRYFTATSPFVEYYIIAREAIAARKLQFRINEYGRNDTFFCWGLVLLGCPIDNTNVIPTSVCPTQATSTAALINMTSTIPSTSACPTITAAVTSTAAPCVTSARSCQTMTSLMTITSTVNTVLQSSCEAAQLSTIAGSIAGGVVVLVVGVVMIVSAIILCIVTLACTRRKRQSVDILSLEERRPTLVQLENQTLYEREREGSMISNQLYKSNNVQHTSTLYESVEQASDGSKVVQSMSDLDHSFQCRYTEVTVDPSGVTDDRVPTDRAAQQAKHDGQQVSAADQLFEQANVPGPSDITIYDNVAYASSKQS